MTSKSASIETRCFIARPPSLHRPSHHHRLPPLSALADTATVVILSAIPFTAVKAFANSDAGRAVYQRILDQRESLEAQKIKFDQDCRIARALSPYYGPQRPKFLGPIASFSYPDHLDGSSPGDYGYDPLNLSRGDATKAARYTNLEILHARWAMLGALGALIPEWMQQAGLANFPESRWWAVGRSKLEGNDLDYFGIPGFHIAGSQGLIIIAFCQLILMGGPEYARFVGIRGLEPLGINLPGDENYPGGILFDPLNLSRDPFYYEEMRVKEIKNGRLAMMAWLGFFVQAGVTREGAWENWVDFLHDPVHNNIFKYL